MATVAPEPKVLAYSPLLRQRTFHDCTADEVLFGGAAGPGKATPLDTPVPTPDGWTTIGELVPGASVFSESGQPIKVLGLSPIHLEPKAYRITFDDQSTITCCEDHLWLTFDAKELAAMTRRDPEWRAARRAKRKSRVTGKRSAAFTAWLTERNQTTRRTACLPAPLGSVRSTGEIARTLKVGRRANHAIPVAAPLELPEQDLPLDPYLLGLWLGDGSS